MSVAPPGGFGTSRRIGRDGYCAAAESAGEEHPAFRLTVAGEDATATDWSEPLRGLTGVLKVDPIEARPEYRIEFDETQLDTNRLLQAIIGLNIPIAAFAEDRRHLNEAFMDLTERGVK